MSSTPTRSPSKTAHGGGSAALRASGAISPATSGPAMSSPSTCSPWIAHQHKRKELQGTSPYEDEEEEEEQQQKHKEKTQRGRLTFSDLEAEGDEEKEGSDKDSEEDNESEEDDDEDYEPSRKQRRKRVTRRRGKKGQYKKSRSQKIHQGHDPNDVDEHGVPYKRYRKGPDVAMVEDEEGNIFPRKPGRPRRVNPVKVVEFVARTNRTPLDEERQERLFQEEEGKQKYRGSSQLPAQSGPSQAIVRTWNGGVGYRKAGNINTGMVEKILFFVNRNSRYKLHKESHDRALELERHKRGDRFISKNTWHYWEQLDPNVRVEESDFWHDPDFIASDSD